MKTFNNYLLILLSIIVLYGCIPELAKKGKISFEENPSAVIIDKKELPEGVMDFFKLNDEQYLFLGVDSENNKWVLREYSLNKDYRILDNYEIKSDNERYIYGGIFNGNFVLFTSVFDDDENYNIYLRVMNTKSGKLTEEKKCFKYVSEEKIKIDGEEEYTDNYRAFVVYNYNSNYIALLYKSYIDDKEMYKITGSVFDNNLKEIYNFSKILREEEILNSFFISKKGDFYASTFFNNEQNDKKQFSLYKFSNGTSDQLEYELPFSILDEEDYNIKESKIIEDKNDKIVVSASLAEDDLIAMFFTRYDDSSNKLENSKIFELTEEVLEKLCDSDDLNDKTSFIHFSNFGDNKFMLIFEEITLITYTKDNIVVSKVGRRGPIYFMTFDKNFEPLWQSYYKKRFVSVVEQDLYTFETNSENCINFNNNHFDYYVYLRKPYNGFYRYEFDPEKNEFKNPYFLFEFSGGFWVLDRKFIKTPKGILFVPCLMESNVIPASLSRNYRQELYHIDYK